MKSVKKKMSMQIQFRGGLRVLLKNLYQADPNPDVRVGVYEIEQGRQHVYVAALVHGANVEVWGTGESPYETLLDASEKWSNAMAGFNPFAQALRSFFHPLNTLK